MALADDVRDAVGHLSLKPEDSAAVALAEAYAEAIDGALESRDPMTITKSLYLGPHLLKTLGELGATPAGRAAMAAKIPEKPAEDESAKKRRASVSLLADMRKGAAG